MIRVEFFSSDAMLERGGAEQVFLGPFPFVQQTYELLRVGPDGDDLAVCNDGEWRIAPDEEAMRRYPTLAGFAGQRFSDFVVSTWEESDRG